MYQADWARATMITTSVISLIRRHRSNCVFSNIQDHDTPMDQGLRSQLVQNHSRPLSLTKQPRFLCHIWSKHGDGLRQLSVPKHHV